MQPEARFNVGDILSPDSVAVVGVSEDAAKLGNTVCRNLIGGGYAGRIFPVGGAASFMGRQVYPSLAALPAAPDLVFLAIPAAATLAAFSQAAAMGTRAVVIGASGFAESGAAGIQLQGALKRALQAVSTRIIGPNTNGIYCTAASLSLGFNTAHAVVHPAGDIAILSHSGALFDAMCRRLDQQGAGLSFFIAAGNELDLTILDYLAYAIADPATRVIALVLDAVSDGRRLRRLAAEARAAGKTILALKAGQSERGAEVAAAHSSRLAGAAAGYDALLAGAGIFSASSLEGLMMAAAALARFGRFNGGLVGMSSSGFGAALIADHAASRQVRLAAYSPETIKKLQDRQKFSRLANPTDLGFFGMLDHLGESIPVMSGDLDAGMFLMLLHSIGEHRARIIADAVAAAIASSGKPHFILAPGSLPPAEMEIYTAAGAQVFSETSACFDAAAAILMPPPEAARIDGIDGSPRIAGAEGSVIAERECLALLRQAGIATVDTVSCADVQAACLAAACLGWPVALKGVEANILHKTERNLVALDLADEPALRAAYAAMPVQTVLVQPMLRGTLEIIVGIADFDDTGPLLMVGLGGIFAEALAQTKLWSLPVSRPALAAGLDDCAVGRILSNPRWPHPDSREAVLDMLMAVQRLALANDGKLRALDINPVILGGFGAVAVDAAAVIGSIAKSLQ